MVGVGYQYMRREVCHSWAIERGNLIGHILGFPKIVSSRRARAAVRNSETTENVAVVSGDGIICGNFGLGRQNSGRIRVLFTHKNSLRGKNNVGKLGLLYRRAGINAKAGVFAIHEESLVDGRRHGIALGSVGFGTSGTRKNAPAPRQRRIRWSAKSAVKGD